MKGGALYGLEQYDALDGATLQLFYSIVVWFRYCIIQYDYKSEAQDLHKLYSTYIPRSKSRTPLYCLLALL